MHLTRPGGSDSLSARVAGEFAPPQFADLEQWSVVRHLGSGTTAHVWLLEQDATGVRVAAKTPRTPEHADVLSREADIARGLCHDNIVRCVPAQGAAYALGDLCDWATFWEVLPAGSVATLLAAVGQLELAQAVTVLLPMVQATNYLHARGIIHGDIAPANILFDATGRPVLIDLGTAALPGDSPEATGTPGFIAPEIADRCAPEALGPAADVYALGALGWFCLTGELPGPASVRIPLVTLRPDLDVGIAEVLEQALAQAPQQRPSLRQLETSVAAWATPEPVDLYAVADPQLAMLLPTRNPVRRTGRRRRAGLRLPRLASSSGRLLALGVAGCVAAIGVSLVALPTQQQAADPPSQSVSAQPATLDVQGVVDALAQRRSAAWNQAAAEQVAGYAAPGSAVYAADHAALLGLAQDQSTLDGIRMRATVHSVTQTTAGLQLTVVWQTDGYVQRNAAGDAVQTVPARSEALVLSLVESDHGWLLSTVKSGPP